MLEFVGERFEVPGAAERILDGGDVGLGVDHLLGADGDLVRDRGRGTERLVEGGYLQALDSGHGHRQGLHGTADDVIGRLGGGDPGLR